MDFQFGRGLDGLAGVVATKWFAGMGLIGMILFVTALVIDLPTDRETVICIGLVMMGWGFGQAECRTFRSTLYPGMKITGPAWRLTVSGALLFLIALGAGARLIWTLTF